MTQPYDLNFCFPVPEALENERIKLTPFIPSSHAQQFFSVARLHPDIFRYLPFGPFKDIDDFLINLIEHRIRRDPGYILFVIFDKTRKGVHNQGGELAGLLGVLNSSPANLATEIGCVMILPSFQRTHVASNAVGLLLHYGLDLPESGGLGLRRMLWQANALNIASIRLAERMAFKLEGILKWDRVLPDGKDDATNGRGIRPGDPQPKCGGRDTAMLSLCWDDWEGGGKEHVDKVMARTR